MTEAAKKPYLVVGVAPLWELEYTGIANVVYELALRFNGQGRERFDVLFSVFNKLVDKEIIENCISQRSGMKLRQAFESGTGITEIPVNEQGLINGRAAFGLFLHTKPPKRVFCKDSHLYYDFSFLLTPECHTQDNVTFHLDGLVQQIETTDLFFAISEATARDLRWMFNIPENRVVVTLLGNNADTTAAEAARRALGKSLVEPYFLMLGTIEPRKNIPLVLDWLSINREFLTKFRVVFAGREGWGKSFRQYLIDYQLEDMFEAGRIVHLGYVTEELKATLIVAAKAVIYPSLFEGFGLPVLEAMALGTPVLASCSTSIPEVLGETGYYYDPYSIESFGSAIREFFYDESTGYIEKRICSAKARAAQFSYDDTFNSMYSALVSEFCDSVATLD